MKQDAKKRIYWRGLDDLAKIFSLSCNRTDTSIFRLSTNLKQKVNPEQLQKALIITLEKYKDFRVKVKRGFFWYYLVENNKEPIINHKIIPTFRFFHTEDNNEYLFKVSYEGKKITIDYFHILTDGNSGREFFNEIIYNYIKIKHPKSISEIEINEENILKKSENSYSKNYCKKIGKKYNPPQAFQVKGQKIANGQIGINHFNIQLAEIKRRAKEKECSISTLLVSMIAYSLYETNYKHHNGKKPINICVPINLKKYFPSDTISNFVSHMMISLKLNSKKSHTFDEILTMVKKEFEKKLNLERITATMNSNGKAINNFFVKILPLAIKKSLVVIGSLTVKKQFTMTFSNLGENSINKKYKKFVDSCDFTLVPDWAEKIRCGVCSYNDKLIVTFSSNIEENSFEYKFRDLLREMGIKVKIRGNGIKTIAN